MSSAAWAYRVSEVRSAHTRGDEQGMQNSSKWSTHFHLLYQSTLQSGPCQGRRCPQPRLPREVCANISALLLA